MRTMKGIELFGLIQRVSTCAELLEHVKENTKTNTKATIQSKCGNVYEKLWDLVIKFGYCKNLPNDLYDHYEGNMNTCELKKVDNLETYIQKMSVFSKAKGGSSDITLRDKTTGKWVFVSSKFYLDDNKKSIDKYDVEKILANINENPHEYKDFDIYLCVNDKQKLLNTIASSHSTNNYIKNNIDHILDLSDLEVCFQHLKNSIQDIPFSQINSLFCNQKIPLQLRFHQDMITHKQMNKINEGAKEILLGAKARSGKTYCVGGLLIKYYKKNEYLNALIITPSPKETISQFTDDLFHHFRDFIGINVVEIKKGSDFESMVLQENNIVIVSKQLLDDYVFEKKITAIQSIHLDFIVFDENHFHGTTQMSKNIIQSYSSQKTIKLYLTATYAKPLHTWNISDDCQFYWDIEDEHLCKSRNVAGLLEKHGKDVELFVNDENKEPNLSVYDNMPDLHIITNLMDQQRYEMIKEKIRDTSYGFSMSTLFCGEFPNEVDIMLRYITGSEKEIDYPNRDMSIFGRIRRMSIKEGSRTTLNNGNFTSQLWFLPFGSNLGIDKVSEHLKDRMHKNCILQNYEIKIVNSKKEYNLKNIKSKIANWELKAKDEGKCGLILLAGNQLTLGITLPFVDIVFLLNDIVSSDKIIQMMYRCMTETIHNADNDRINDGNKKMGFVVDLNLSRVLNTILDYKVHKKDLNVEQKITYLVENNLINIDSDLFINKENKTKLIEKLLIIWKKDPVHNLKSLLRKIEDDIVELDTTDQKWLNNHFLSSIGDKKLDSRVKLDEDSMEALATGRKMIKDENSVCSDTGSKTETEDPKSIHISLTRDVLPFVLPLSCILTMHKKENDILTMLNIIKTDPSLLRVFNDQSFIWWNKRDIIEMIEHIVEKYVKKSSSIYTISIQFKMSLQCLIDKPKELLELIDSCLKPNQKEKQKYGKVFTPMHLVFEMLEKLDKHYIKIHGRSIFAEKEFKWFDPAVGMGNFPVAVYLKLMDGLKTQIPNDEERKRHIIENMLYMSEIIQKNVFVCHQIFNVNNQYKMNIYEGDTLELDVVREWGVTLNGFDVVLGNPPFNKDGIRSHTGKQLGEKNETIWPKFIEKSFEWLRPDGFLVFINPLSWLKKSHSLHNSLLEKHIVWLKLWDDSQSKCSINADIPISLYVLQNTMNQTNNPTEIRSEIKRKKLVTTSLEHLNKNYSIPLAFHSIFDKLIKFIETHNCRLDYKTKTVTSSGTKTKIPSIYTLADEFAIDTYTLDDGILVKKATEKHPDADKRKLIIANKRGFKGAFIDEGKLSLTGNHKFYILGDNLEVVKKILDFNISTLISDYPKYGQSFLDNDAFKFIPDIRKLGIVDITEEEFYKLIGLTVSEINQMQSQSMSRLAQEHDDSDSNSEMTDTPDKKTTKTTKTTKTNKK